MGKQLPPVRAQARGRYDATRQLQVREVTGDARRRRLRIRAEALLAADQPVTAPELDDLLTECAGELLSLRAEILRLEEMSAQLDAVAIGLRERIDAGTSSQPA
jgi:hypothetical protein